MSRTLTHPSLHDPDIEDDGPWFCLQHNELFCPDCKELQSYIHLLPIGGKFPCIIIFDRKDDEILLEVATRYKKKSLNPRIVEYDPDIGTSMTIYDVCNMLEVNYDTYPD